MSCKKCTVCEDIMVCPITRATMKDPVIARDTYTYERDAIETWLRLKGTSPLIPSMIMHISELISNRSIKILIEASRNENEKEVEELKPKTICKRKQKRKRKRYVPRPQDFLPIRQSFGTVRRMQNFEDSDDEVIILEVPRSK